MQDINTLQGSGVERAVLYKDERDDGLTVEYCRGRCMWYRADSGKYIRSIFDYDLWQPA